MAKERNFSDWILMMRDFMSLLNNPKSLEDACSVLSNAEKMSDENRRESEQARIWLEEYSQKLKEIESREQAIKDGVIANTNSSNALISEVATFNAAKSQYEKEKELFDLAGKKSDHDSRERSIASKEKAQQEEDARLSDWNKDLQRREDELSGTQTQLKAIVNKR